MTSTIITKHNPPHLRVEDVVSVEKPFPPNERRILDDYFSAFAQPVVQDGRHLCPGCGEEQAWRWGLTHGEANSICCGWPGRGMHYIGKQENGECLLRIRNVFFAYHPDGVTECKS